ncbi:uncharacterized protein A1O9_02694 [Exophiala aquamarina CBS 119918]|uniref:Uncharacterized protein n=1 Tax=Exophiala aquamarina CBS 119918 TaxID=1182545 RepID=A0A072PM04_9EURO|nr:uncharacterized protein A1O9_02694 [Exophiala aquamarina CBS 119918]KEF61129.1 hypothetical protein A1O9_02694 [Exophiala aquamarina CBS 119918]
MAAITTTLSTPIIYTTSIDGTETVTSISIIEFTVSPTGTQNLTTISTTAPSTTTVHETAIVTAPPPPPGNNCPSTTGPIAGAAVGCLIGGALIAALLTFFIMSSRNRSRRHKRSSRWEKVACANEPKESPPDTSVGAWEKHLPQPEADSDLRSAVSGLFDQIEMHVEQYYQDIAVKIDPLVHSNIAHFDSHLHQAAILDLLATTRRPTMLIKHAIAYFIVSSISAESNSAISFLPADFTALPQSIQSATATKNNSMVFDAAYCKWRVLTAYLHPQPENDRAYTAARDMAIANAAENLCHAFSPWARDREGTRRGNLVSIMKVAAEVGVTMFSQPSTLVWDWRLSRHGEQGHRGMRLVLRPGLIRTTSAEARPLETPQVIVPPVARDLEVK